MKILVTENVPEYGVTNGQLIDTDVDALTETQALVLVALHKASTDDTVQDTRRISYVPGKIYKNEANMIKDNCEYQLKVTIPESSPKWVVSEWNLILQGSTI